MKKIKLFSKSQKSFRHSFNLTELTEFTQFTEFTEFKRMPFSIENRRSTPKSKSDLSLFIIPSVDIIEQSNYQLTEWGNELENIIDKRLYNEDALASKKHSFILPSLNVTSTNLNLNELIIEEEESILKEAEESVKNDKETQKTSIDIDELLDSIIQEMQPLQESNKSQENSETLENSESKRLKESNSNLYLENAFKAESDIPLDKSLNQSKSIPMSNILSDPILDGTPLRISNTGIILEHTFSLIPTPVIDTEYTPPLPPLDLSCLYNRYESLIEETVEKK